MKVVFACAGTGGHINPAIAIAKKIVKEEKNSEILFIGTKQGLENKLVNEADFKISHIRTGKIIRSLTFRNFKEMKNAYLGISDAKKVLKEFKPDLVIGTGGYICVPVMFACQKLKIPYILHESNSYPGVAVKLFAKKAAYMMVGFKETKKRLKYKNNVVFTGSPAKFDELSFAKLDKEKCKEDLGLKGIDKKIVLVTCGSQGAQKVNETLISMLEKYQDNNILYILVTGDKNYDEIVSLKENLEKKINKSLDSNIILKKFVYEMDKMYKVADLCVTRAGAMTITELALSKSKSILIPLPSAAENHQYYNAKVLEETGCAKILEQKDLNIESLHESVNQMLNNKCDLNKLSLVIKKDVSEEIYKCIKNVVK